MNTVIQKVNFEKKKTDISRVEKVHSVFLGVSSF